MGKFFKTKPYEKPKKGIKLIREVVFNLSFQIGVNIIGLPEFHVHELKYQQETQI